MESAAEHVRAWAARAERHASAASTMADEIARISATARDASGAITVTVDAAGALVGLELGDAVQRMSPARLAAEIMATVRTARGDIVGKVASVVDATVGAGSPTGAAVMSGLERRFGQRRSEGSDET